MKKILTFIALVAVCFCVNAQQEFKIGPKAGVNFAKLSNTSKSKVLTGFYLGAVGELKITDRFSVQPEIVYSTQGAKNVYSESLLGVNYQHHNHDKVSYINIPVLAKYYITNALSIEVGPQFGFLVDATNKDRITANGIEVKQTRDFKDEVNSFDFGLAGGLAYDLANGFFVNARYNFGLTNVGKSNYYYGDSKNRVFQLGAGYKF